jgi:hypothetical protein
MAPGADAERPRQPDADGLTRSQSHRNALPHSRLDRHPDTGAANAHPHAGADAGTDAHT